MLAVDANGIFNATTRQIEYVEQTVEPRSAEEIQQLETEYRAYRNRLIAQTDWVTLPDVNLPNKAAWLVYRQQLRDITNQSGFPTDIDWPVAPS
jgi:hypothetical protein